MIITLNESHKVHLMFLFSQPNNVLQDFCKLSLEYLTKGPNLKLYQNAGQKLSVDSDIVQNAVEGLINLMIECCRYQVSPLDLRDTILTVGFNEEQHKILEAFYNSKRDELTQILAERTVDIPQFKNLEWRLEAQVASRALLEQMTPQVTMKFTLDCGSEPKNILLEADTATLVHMTDILEAALTESKSQHFRRIQRRLL